MILGRVIGNVVSTMKDPALHGQRLLLVQPLDPHGDDPYETSAADRAVVFEDGATIMRPTAMARRAEADRIEAEFARLDVPLALRSASQ